jgi:hypothetical protein
MLGYLRFIDRGLNSHQLDLLFLFEGFDITLRPKTKLYFCTLRKISLEISEKTW